MSFKELVRKEHIIKQNEVFLKSVEQALTSPATATPDVEIVKPLPLPVQNFCAEVDKTFLITANALEDTAKRLEDAAAELRSRAKDLRDASPDVRGHVERWIQFERESNERGKFLNALFEKR